MNRAGRSTSKNGKSRRDEQPDPFRFGWREVQQLGANGVKERMRVPLTPEDVLHPKKGYQILENTQQERDRRYLCDVLKWRLADNPQALVMSDCLIVWGIRGLGNHSPDISVFEGVKDAHSRDWGEFVVAVEGAQPMLVIEVVSPDAHDRQARDNDVVIKVREYYRARMPLYVIVDQERKGGPRSIIGYRRGTRKYVKVPLDDQGRLLLGPMRLLLGLREERVRCWDAATGEEIPEFTQMAQAHAAESQARQEAEATLAAALARIRELEARGRNGG